MAPESLCFHEGRLESSSGSWAGKRVIYSCCTGPPRAPAPAPGTCHQAFCSDRAGIRWSWRAGPSSGPAGAMERLGPPLLPRGLAPLSCWREDVTASQKQDFFFPPNVSPPQGTSDKEYLVLCFPEPQVPKLGAVPLTLSLHAPPCCCCHHKLEPHRKAPESQPAGEGDAPEFILRIFSLMPLFLVPSVGEAAGGICVLQISLPSLPSPGGCWGKVG